MADNATNRGSQKVARESDAVIVPMTPGNAGIGKDVHTVRTCPRETLTAHRGRLRGETERDGIVACEP